ncbi:hypothetical protein CHS0354_012654 [Potamilus streckersoni]|uniref:Uncharacterized protein n=1 Tax=Potamilus streckersoni TaxID=2493646 RepID=A0AAE0SYH8_9BIVA|nr:hypothetical protein CHS0354_012654 [Potamilus streckersoni]
MKTCLFSTYTLHKAGECGTTYQKAGKSLRQLPTKSTGQIWKLQSPFRRLGNHSHTSAHQIYWTDLEAAESFQKAGKSLTTAHPIYVTDLEAAEYFQKTVKSLTDNCPPNLLDRFTSCRITAMTGQTLIVKSDLGPYSLQTTGVVAFPTMGRDP